MDFGFLALAVVGQSPKAAFQDIGGLNAIDDETAKNWNCFFDQFVFGDGLSPAEIAQDPGSSFYYCYVLAMSHYSNQAFDCSLHGHRVSALTAIRCDISQE